MCGIQQILGGQIGKFLPVIITLDEYLSHLQYTLKPTEMETLFIIWRSCLKLMSVHISKGTGRNNVFGSNTAGELFSAAFLKCILVLP